MAFIFFCICLMQQGHTVWYARGDKELPIVRASRIPTEVGKTPGNISWESTAV